MRLTLAFGMLAMAFGLVSAASSGLVHQRAASSYAGYLVTTFSGSDNLIHQYLSVGNNARSFRKLSRTFSAQGVGTGAGRDPYLVSNGKEYFIIATDLNIGAIQNNWHQSVTHGSRGILVWRSTDLVTWSSPRLVTVEEPTAGMVWAPSAVFNGQGFDVFWSSALFAATDTGHTGKPTPHLIRTARTSDFTSFTKPKTYLSSPTSSLIDQEFLKVNGGWVRFLKDETKKRVTQEFSRSSSVLGSDWTSLGNVVEQAREGPAAFQDNLTGGYHLWLDNYSGAGNYEAYETSTIAPGSWKPSPAGSVPSGLRHGSVTRLTKAQYDALNAK